MQCSEILFNFEYIYNFDLDEEYVLLDKLSIPCRKRRAFILLREVSVEKNIIIVFNTIYSYNC